MKSPTGATATALGPLPVKSFGAVLETVVKVEGSPALEIFKIEMDPGMVWGWPSAPAFPSVVAKSRAFVGSTARPICMPSWVAEGAETGNGLPSALSVPSEFTVNARTSLQNGFAIT